MTENVVVPSAASMPSGGGSKLLQRSLFTGAAIMGPSHLLEDDVSVIALSDAVRGALQKLVGANRAMRVWTARQKMALERGTDGRWAGLPGDVLKSVLVLTAGNRQVVSRVLTGVFMALLRSRATAAVD
jgi:hypothetical protein